MGDPSILPAAAEPTTRPPKLRVLWTVYRLRAMGEKLPAEHVHLAGTGTLEFWAGADGAIHARLMDPSGYPTLDALDRVRLRPCKGGLLLHGTTLSAKKGDVRELPQAWWCVVQSAAPA
ncbi:hypothetical protein FN976_07945 [Caenimonas sedimenti]|uniref:Uncharacterized protein n=1 Tax=Caenimonas sedimenti TaxID=2596921 RepID=A0A562ZTU9_9BURK|nr:hypothetical protein [Caenimonas sedimenti]TWO71913.1 hypothetical protein FN976_07945 [Caenimonas sedimenti]